MLGNLRWESLGTLYKDGRTKADRINLLWNKMKKFYKLFKPPSQIQKLTEDMINKDKKSPKLKAKGAETRH